MATLTTTPYGTVGQDVVGTALTGALEQAQTVGGKPTPLPAYTERTGPVQMGYGVEYQGVSPYQTSGVNWADYQQQARQPVTQAYEQNLRDIQQQMGTTGLMGSRGYGMHGDTLARAGEAYGRGLLGADTTAMQMQQEQEKARYAADLAEAQRRQAFGEQQFGWEYGQQQQQADWANQEAARREAYDLQQRAIQEQARLEPYQMNLGLATGAMPAATAATQADMTAQQAAAQQQAANTAGWMGLAGTGMGLLGSTYGQDGWTFSDVGDLFSGWF